MKTAAELLEVVKVERERAESERLVELSQFLSVQMARIEAGMLAAARDGAGTLRILLSTPSRQRNVNNLLSELHGRLTSCGYDCSMAPVTPSDCPEHRGTRGVCHCGLHTYWCRVKFSAPQALLDGLGIDSHHVFTVENLNLDVDDAKPYDPKEDDE